MITRRISSSRRRSLFFVGGPLNENTSEMESLGMEELVSLPTMTLLGRTLQFHEITEPGVKRPPMILLYQIVACQIFADQDLYQCKFLGSVESPVPSC